MIIGIDEVGRGAWAGPVVVGAVGLGGVEIPGLTDSKLLSKKKRLAFSQTIKQSASYIGIGWVSATDIDQIGISAALKLATARALAQIDMDAIEQIIIDGTIRLFDDPRVITMKKADLLVPSVSAASVIAKVARDQYMALCDQIFPEYGFANHVGYGALKHREAIDQYGLCGLHRRCFEPMRTLTNYQILHTQKSVRHNTSVSSGRNAENAAAVYLQEKGYTIISQNWKTKWCEIDIIAQKNQLLYFVEVKYRYSPRQGGGISAITPKKLQQMRFAAQFWMHANRYTGDAVIAVMDVTGKDFTIQNFIKCVE